MLVLKLNFVPVVYNFSAASLPENGEKGVFLKKTPFISPFAAAKGGGEREIYAKTTKLKSGLRPNKHYFA